MRDWSDGLRALTLLEFRLAGFDDDLALAIWTADGNVHGYGSGSGYMSSAYTLAGRTMRSPCSDQNNMPGIGVLQQLV